MDSVKTKYRVEGISTILSVQNMSKSRAFYKDILGFEEAEWGNDNFTAFSRNGEGMYLCKGGQGQRNTWVWIGFAGDIFALHNELLVKGVIIKQPPKNYSWALEMHVKDPDGHILRFGKESNPLEPYVDHEMKSAYV